MSSPGLNSGLQWPQATMRYSVIIGRVTDFFGTTRQEIRAPFAGELLYVVATPAMNEGEPVGFIGTTAK